MICSILKPAVPVRDVGVTKRPTRRALMGGLIAGAFWAKHSAAAPVQTTESLTAAPPVFPWLRLLSDLAITDGPYQGAFRATPNGPINWYFANLGLAFVTSELPILVRDYLDAYLRSIDPIRIDIADVGTDLKTPIMADSNDAYAGTFLTLATKYASVTGDQTWWNRNLVLLKAVAYRNIAAQVKANGLVRAFQAPHENDIGYLMDQCEAYSGIRDFSQRLLELGDRDAAYFAGFGANLGTAIHSLFDANANRWRWSDVSPAKGDAWYPNLTAQIYPHLCDVHSPDAMGDYYRLRRGYDLINQTLPDWMNRPMDSYPWLVVGYYAACRQGQTANSLSMLSTVEEYFLPGLVNTGRMLISEIGYAKGIIDLAAGQRASVVCVAQ